MKKYLLPKEGKFYKANLHMHTTISDGRMTLEETKREFMKHGYSIVAFTDHEVMVPHKELTDDNFLAITSTEIIVNLENHNDFGYIKTYHLNIYSPIENKSDYNTFNKDIMWLKHSYDFITEKQSEVKYQRKYGVEFVNEIIQKAKEENCLVSYNHPVWSLQDYSDYSELKGLWGVEWHNTGCVRAGYEDSMQPIDDLLRKGERVYPLATDDAHHIDDCFGGFVMVKAKQLEYSVVFDALRNGDFYSSTGPEIFELTYEDGKVHIKTSPARSIYLSTERRETRWVEAKQELLSEATFDITNYLSRIDKSEIANPYIRLTVIDKEGKRAHTRAYFVDELTK